MESDIVREEEIKSFGISVICFKNAEVRTDIENVVRKIKEIISEFRKNEENREITD